MDAAETAAVLVVVLAGQVISSSSVSRQSAANCRPRFNADRWMTDWTKAHEQSHSVLLECRRTSITARWPAPRRAAERGQDGRPGSHPPAVARVSRVVEGGRR